MFFFLASWLSFVLFSLSEEEAHSKIMNTELGEKFTISRTYIYKILHGNAAISVSAIATHQPPATASEASSEAVGCMRLLALYSLNLNPSCVALNPSDS